MVDESEVFEAADCLQAQGRMVSIRNVRESLERRGSHRDIGPLVAQWKIKRSYQPRTEIEGVPLRIQSRHGDALAALWGDARAEAARDLEGERDHMRATVRANNEVRDEALLDADRLNDQVSKLQAEVAQLQELLNDRDARLVRVRAEEFWDRVMREIVEILPANGGMAVEDILPNLRETIHREAALHKESVTLAIIRKKMRTRVTHGRYFAEQPDGSFSRRL